MAGQMVGRDLPAKLEDPPRAGTHAVQVLRTYPARLRRYPFAPLGERTIDYAYRKVLKRVRRLIYLEDQYLWAPFVADLLADALRAEPRPAGDRHRAPLPGQGGDGPVAQPGRPAGGHRGVPSAGRRPLRHLRRGEPARACRCTCTPRWSWSTTCGP